MCKRASKAGALKPFITSKWANPVKIDPHAYQCGHCDQSVASDHGYQTTDGRVRLLLCPLCNHPSVHDAAAHTLFPSASPGGRVDHLPNDVDRLYEEARAAAGASAPTAAVLATRKLLMHVAVDCGAPAGKSFLSMSVPSRITTMCRLAPEVGWITFETEVTKRTTRFS